MIDQLTRRDAKRVSASRVAVCPGTVVGGSKGAAANPVIDFCGFVGDLRGYSGETGSSL